MKFLFGALVALALFLPRVHAADDWILVAKTSNTHFFIYKNSLNIGQTDDNQKIFYVIGKYLQPATNQSDIHLWYIPVEHCLIGKGKFYIGNTQGQKISDVDFEFGDETVAATLSKIICNTAINRLIQPGTKV